MYKSNPKAQLSFENFYLPFSGKLKTNNKWIKLSKLIPWDLIEEEYKKSLDKTQQGAPAINSRVAFGSLIIQQYKRLTDREVVEEIIENPYLQYFLGYTEYQHKTPFNPSMLVHFRKRISPDVLSKVNDKIISRVQVSKVTDGMKPLLEVIPNLNKGKLIVDATVAPADITYPSDLKLLNSARIITEKIIDKLHSPLKGKKKKPRTYRKKAGSLFRNLSKKNVKIVNLFAKA